MNPKRIQIIETTCELMEKQGYHATGINQILSESAAPRGSLYYYFPDGKEGLAAEAIEYTGKRLSDRIINRLADDQNAAESIPTFIKRIANSVEASNFQAGGPLTTVAMETATTSDRLNLACRAAYNQIQTAFYQKLIPEYEPERAEELATFITAAVEGAIILSRTNHSGDPLRLISKEIGFLLECSKQ